GLPLVLPPFKGRVHPKYNCPEFLNAISDCQALFNEPSCRILLEGRNRVASVQIPVGENKSAEIVIKEFRVQGINALKSLFLPSKAKKAWRGSMELIERELATPHPAAYLEKRKGRMIDQSFYLSEWVEDVKEIRLLFRQLPHEELKELLAALAAHLFFSHQKGILHRDLSDGNVLAKKSKTGKYVFYLVDTNRIKIKQKISPLSRMKNLIRFGVPPSYQRFFLEQYLRVKPAPKFLWFWYKINKNTYTMYIKTKKMLRLKQIARKLKIQ
ncbi:MAG: phosphotransferase, partial [Candidatus Aminicenantes bacterium]|nr:phosphotransferase [Candidatus Aminicenantes bacterium]